ncbi:MAG: hypothetical protein K9G26_09755 [Emcibacter sp.]|nr:hypothetical protein [Emcibacter sp.]
MKFRHKIGILFLWVALPFCFINQAFSNEYTNDINVADNKLILEQYEEAKKIYERIINTSDYSVVKAYAHYKLGSLYNRQNENGKAKIEYEKGLVVLKNAGENNHKIGKYLAHALEVTTN